MAKIFRKIRQKFIEEKKIKNYTLYAIGEILLVVIGILIALQINSVNQERQRAKLEKVLLSQVKFEVLEIYEDIWRDAVNLDLGNKSHYRISEYIDRDLPYNDSLCFDFYWLQKDEYVYPTSAAYTRLKEVGLDIIKNDTARIALQAIYEGHFPRLTKNNTYTPDISEVLNDYYLNSFRPNKDMELRFEYELPPDTVGSRVYSNEYYDYPSNDKRYGNEYTIGYVPLDFESLKKDPRFLMLLEQTKRYRSNKQGHYAAVKEIIKLAVDIINKELELAR